MSLFLSILIFQISSSVSRDECKMNERIENFIHFLGFLIDFVSGPVSSGFTSAVALIIVTSQIKDILGISAKGSQFIEMWQNISRLIHQTSAWDATLGATCIALLLILRVIIEYTITEKFCEKLLKSFRNATLIFKFNHKRFRYYRLCEI